MPYCIILGVFLFFEKTQGFSDMETFMEDEETREEEWPFIVEDSFDQIDFSDGFEVRIHSCVPAHTIITAEEAESRSFDQTEERFYSGMTMEWIRRRCLSRKGFLFFSFFLLSDICSGLPLYFWVLRHKNTMDEVIVYVGSSLERKNRFKTGHKAAILLLDPKYDSFDKFVYFGEVVIKSADSKVHLPAEVFREKGRKVVQAIEIMLQEAWINPNADKERYQLLTTWKSRPRVTEAKGKWISAVRFNVNKIESKHPFPLIVPFPERFHLCIMCPCQEFSPLIAKDLCRCGHALNAHRHVVVPVPVKQ